MGAVITFLGEGMESTAELIGFVKKFEDDPQSLNEPENRTEIARMFNVMGPLDVLTFKNYVTERKASGNLWEQVYSIVWGNMRSAAMTMGG